MAKHFILFIYLSVLFFIVFAAGNDYRFSHLFASFGTLNLFPLRDKILFLQHPEDWGGNNMYFFLKEITGNLLLFFPLSLILILLYDVSKNKTIVYSLLLSCAIESLQLLTGMGNADIDDVILNTLGAVLGTFFAFWLKKRTLWQSIKISLRLS